MDVAICIREGDRETGVGRSERRHVGEQNRRANSTIIPQEKPPPLRSPAHQSLLISSAPKLYLHTQTYSPLFKTCFAAGYTNLLAKVRQVHYTLHSLPLLIRFSTE